MIGKWQKCIIVLMGYPSPLLLFIFGLDKQPMQFLQQISVKNVHPVSSAEMCTQDLVNMSHLP